MEEKIEKQNLKDREQDPIKPTAHSKEDKAGSPLGKLAGFGKGSTAKFQKLETLT